MSLIVCQDPVVVYYIDKITNPLLNGNLKNKSCISFGRFS